MVIRIRNENGTLVGWDTDTGEAVPLDFGDITADSVSVNEFATGSQFVCFQKTQRGPIYAVGPTGELEAGGPDNVGTAVTDSTDFAHILDEIVNNVADSTPSIVLSQLPPGEGDTLFPVNSTVTINRPIALYGQGRNRTFLECGPDVGGETLITIDSGNIVRFERFKCQANAADGTQPDTYIRTNPGVNEVMAFAVEFRDADSWGLFMDNPGNWNSVIDSWFLSGAGLSVLNAGDLRLIGNKFTPTADVDLTDSSNVVRRGNDIRSNNVTLSGVGYVNPTESFGGIVDPGGVERDSLIADDMFGFVASNVMETTVGGGSVTFKNKRVELDQPGDSGTDEEVRFYNGTVAVDPDIGGSITLGLDNVSLGNDIDSRAILALHETPDADEFSGNGIGLRMRGDGVIRLRHDDGVSTSTNADTNLSNSFMNGIHTVTIEFGGGESRYTVESTEGNSTRLLSDNYPSGDNLFVKVGAFDANSTASVPVSFDVTRLGWT